MIPPFISPTETEAQASSGRSSQAEDEQSTGEGRDDKPAKAAYQTRRQIREYQEEVSAKR